MQWLRTALAFFGVLIMLSGYAPTRSYAQTILTEDLFLPIGITTDSPNILVHSDGNTTTLITRFTPSGSIVGTPGELGSGRLDRQRFLGSHMTTSGATGILLLSPDGELYRIDAATLGSALHCDLRRLSIDTNRVFDVQDRTSGPFTLPLPYTYGDLAVVRSDVFITGVSDDNRPFVLRLVFAGCRSATVVLTSSAPSTERGPRGLGAAEDMVMTTLPSSSSPSRCSDAVVTFPAGNVDNANFLSGGDGIPSLGIGTDNDNNFYIATGGGTSACRQRDVVFISRGSGTPSSIQLGMFSATRSEDVDALGDRIYVTISDADVVVDLAAR